MSERKPKNPLPEKIDKDQMIEKIVKTLKRSDYCDVYMIYVCLGLLEKEDSQK